MPNVAQALRDAAQMLAPTSDTARLDAELLMAEALGVDRSTLLLRHLQADPPAGFDALIARRAAHEPVAYILGRQEFYGRDFDVGTGVLIPRADSETIIVAALDAVPSPARMLDCGVGSGALLLTLLAERPRATGIGIDRSAEAVRVAGRNAARLGLSDRVRIMPADWHHSGWARDLGQFGLIVANPPYVEADATLEPSVRNWEPAEALFAGPDGLDDYRTLLPQLPDMLAPDGAAVIEIGASQAESVGSLAQQLGFATELRRDLAARPRALVLRLLAGEDKLPLADGA